jgi:hypothetical protein
VPSDSVAGVQRFGKYLKDVPPGLHFKLPLGIDAATIVPVKRQLKQEFGFATPGATDSYQVSREGKQETQMVTGDLNAALVEWVGSIPHLGSRTRGRSRLHTSHRPPIHHPPPSLARESRYSGSDREKDPRPMSLSPKAKGNVLPSAPLFG